MFIQMKTVISFLFTCCFYMGQAQDSSYKKQSTIGLYFFYNDFATPQLLKANGLGTVLKNNQWNKPHNMQGGFGLDFFKGVTRKTDVVGTVNASWVNYALPGGGFFGSSHLLLDMNAGAHIKLLGDNYTFNPFLITKVGFTSYKNISGFSLQPGAGIQINLFNEAYVITTIEYRAALSNNLSNQLYYSTGIATNIGKKKAKIVKPLVEKLPPPVAKEPEIVVAKEPETVNEEIKITAKEIYISITDEATGQPLQYAEISLKTEDGIIFTAISNTDGKALFSNVAANNYSVTGRLNLIDATTAMITKDEFNSIGNIIKKTITHNDPRFTLVGNAVDKISGRPVANTEVTITNSTRSSTAFAASAAGNGEFRTQLEAASNFTISGKKLDYISNIESISTIGLNRSTTLYVKLQLGIEEAAAGKTIILNKIYFATGKSVLQPASSADLIKLILFLKDNPQSKLKIQGHTDNVGGIASNILLSQLRANSVVNYLVKSGISKTRLMAKGYGPNLPIESNKTAAGKAKNRRVEMKVLETSN